VPDQSQMDSVLEPLSGREGPTQQCRLFAPVVEFVATTIRQPQKAEPQQRPATPVFGAFGLSLLYGMW